ARPRPGSRPLSPGREKWLASQHQQGAAQWGASVCEHPLSVLRRCAPFPRSVASRPRRKGVARQVVFEPGAACCSLARSGAAVVLLCAALGRPLGPWQRST
ncbi:unnamed protein product, partial [Amoebophrya sp. A120]